MFALQLDPPEHLADSIQPSAEGQQFPTWINPREFSAPALPSIATGEGGEEGSCQERYPAKR